MSLGLEADPMRRLLLLIVLLTLGLPSLAQQTVIDDLLISRDGEVVNVRVSLRNAGAATQRGPLQIELFARQSGSPEWLPFHSWTNLSKLGAGHRVSRDFFAEEGDTISTMANQGIFEVRASVTGPGLSHAIEKIAEHDQEEH